MGGSKYFVPLLHRDKVEDLFRSMIYAPTTDRYSRAKQSFHAQAKKISKSLVKYFDKNWDSCSSMWSNHGRRMCFSAGNTTTNRIEASWNQFKQLLGKKSSIDKCVQVILQHQVCVTRQFVTSMAHFELYPPAAPQLPRQLRELAAVLSPFCLRLVQRQWDLNLLHGTNWSWSVSDSEGGVYTATPRNTPITVEWASDRCKCDCLFFASTMLPCQHMMNVMTRCRGEWSFQVAQLEKRWSMAEAKTIEQELTSTISHLCTVRGVRNTIGESLPVKLPTSGKRLGYVKLARRTVCEHAVLSSCEKYNIVHSELSPVIATMQRLPSHLFYKQFADLREVIAAFSRKWDLQAPGHEEEESTDEELDADEPDYALLSREDATTVLVNVDCATVDVASTHMAPAEPVNEKREDETVPTDHRETATFQIGDSTVREGDAQAGNIEGVLPIATDRGAAASSLKHLHSATLVAYDFDLDEYGQRSDEPLKQSRPNNEVEIDPPPDLEAPRLSSEWVIDPSQVSLQDLSISAQSQELMNKADMLLRKANELVGEEPEDQKASPRMLPRRPDVTAHRRSVQPAIRTSNDDTAPRVSGKGPLSVLAKKMRRRAELLAMIGDSDDWESFASSSDVSDDGDSDFEASSHSKSGEVAQLLRARSTRSSGGIDRLTVLNLPSPVPRTSPAKSRRVRRGIVECVSDCPIRVDQLVLWATNTPNIEKVSEVLDKYPVLFKERFLLQKNPTVIEQHGHADDFLFTFVIPRDLLGRVNSALVRWQDDKCAEESADTASTTIPVAFISSELAGLSM
jgi:hypothetical protein